MTAKINIIQDAIHQADALSSRGSYISSVSSVRGGGPGAMANMLNRELAGDIGGDGAANAELDQTEISVVDVQ